MRLLLDTHVFLWYISADPQLPVAFRDAIRDPANEVYLSVASVWEAVIKYAAERNQDLRRDVQHLTAPVQLHHGPSGNRVLRVSSVRQASQDICVDQVGH